MNRLPLMLAGALLVLCAHPARAVVSGRYTVEFSGTLTNSFNYATGGGQFANFAAGSPFHGSFVFDPALITGSDSLTGTAGAFRRYFGALDDYRVEFDLPGDDYVYEPTLVGTGAYAGQTISLWNVANDFTGQPDLSGRSGILAARVQNYPAAWQNGPPGVIIGEVPAAQFVQGWYPHSSFFELNDFEPPLDATAGTSSLVDVAQFFARSGARQYSVRFTDPYDPQWGQSRETVKALLYGEIRHVTVIVPEPTAVALVVAAVATSATGLCARRANGFGRSLFEH